MNKKIVWVDGFKIRNTLDDDFGVFHTHDLALAGYMPKFYIPPGEIWIDHRFKDEQDFFIAVEAFFEERQEPYAEVRKAAQKHFRPAGPVPQYIEKSEERDGLMIRYVNGAVVRTYLDPEFIFGGHDLVYPDYIPKREVWLDIKMDPAELPYVLLHELVERQHMALGKPYHIAHEYATVADKEAKREAGIASYPGDPEYPWRGAQSEQIIKEHYVVQD